LPQKGLHGRREEADAKGHSKQDLMPIFAGTLETPRLLLRRLEERDATEIARLMSDWEVVKQTISIPLPYTQTHAVHWIKRSAKGWRRKMNFCLAIEDKGQGKLVGSLSLRRKSFFSRNVGVLGYWIGRDYWGKGMAGEAVEALLKVGVDGLGLRQVEARVFTDNMASRRVLEKNGFILKSKSSVYLKSRGGKRKVCNYSFRPT
jgi:RimJ/RimL family protein N-acetyltransferase